MRWCTNAWWRVLPSLTNSVRYTHPQTPIPNHWVAQVSDINMLCLRFCHILWMDGPRGGETWICCEETQGSSGYWAQTLGRLPAEGQQYTHTHKAIEKHVHKQDLFISLCSASRSLQARTWLGPSPWLTWLSFQTLLMHFVSGMWLSLILGGRIDCLFLFTNITTEFLLFRLSVGRYPKLAKYYSLLKDRPSIKASRPPHWQASPQGYDILKDLWNIFNTVFTVINEYLLVS